jgi:hypothetical protein
MPSLSAFHRPNKPVKVRPPKPAMGWDHPYRNFLRDHPPEPTPDVTWNSLLNCVMQRATLFAKRRGDSVVATAFADFNEILHDMRARP